jgi:hypothetical protein
MAGGIGLALAALWAGVAPGQAPDGPARPEGRTDAALERAREQVRMLDDLYKNAVVAITQTYVEGQDIEPAIVVAKQVFAAMGAKGWHSARLVDATGSPVSEENAPANAFEEAAAKAIRAGQPYYEEIVGAGAGRTLRAATAVPVVMKKCAECHGGRKVGSVLGFIRYEIPVK